jgi:hypothetical protein
LALILTLGLIPSSTLASAEKEAAALQVARNWLSLVDAGEYDASWEAASAYFKSAINGDSWRSALTGARQPLGKVVSRKLKSRTFATELPGAPDGEYVVIQFDTVFENKRSSTETVTPKKDADGRWRVSGYYIK